MGKNTNIEWCDSTINGSSGCDGCELWNPQVKTCYAGNLQTRRLSKSLPRLYSRDFSEVRMIPGRYAQAASWSDLRGTERPDKPWLNGLPRMIFVGDLGDTFSRAVTDEFLTRELFGAITSKQGQRHFWMLLTKRPSRLAALAKKWGGLPDNVMAMTTITKQRAACVRVGQLLEVPCRWRGLSVEPLLGPVSLLDTETGWPFCDLTGNHQIHLLICGGESGGESARPMHPYWARNLRDECRAVNVPFFFKQWGNWKPSDAQPLRGIANGGGLFLKEDGHTGNQGDWWNGKAVAMDRLKKQEAGRLFGTWEHNGFPKLEGGGQ